MPGNVSAGVNVIARMFDLNSITRQPNTARDCCIQLPGDPVPVNSSCTPDPGCGPRQGSSQKPYSGFDFPMKPQFEPLEGAASASAHVAVASLLPLQAMALYVS